MVLALVVILVFVLIIIFGPALQAKGTSRQFMDAATSADVSRLIELDGATEDSEKQYLESLANTLKGTYAEIANTNENGKWYFLYEIEGAQARYARTIVERVNGKWAVTSIVFGNDELKLVPSDTREVELQTTTNEETTATPESPQPSTSGLSCLSLDDYKYFFFDKKKPTIDYTTRESSGFLPVAENNMYFEPDSIVETSFASTYDDWADFAIKNSSDEWAFVLRGSTYDAGGDSFADPKSVELAQNRVNEVKRELMSRGVPESRIVIGEAINNADEFQDGFNNEIFRRVGISIKNPCAESGIAAGAPSGR